MTPPALPRTALLTSVAVALVTAWFSLVGLGWRHLWVDEVDTAERAAAVLAWGYPRVLDASGEPSLNTGGLELEDGDAHRFSPWGQFYVSAAGLAVGRALGLSPDAAVRAPAALMHVAAAALATWGCVALGGASAAVGAAVGLSVGLDSVRLTYARQARYHAMVELLVVLGLLGAAVVARGGGAGWWLLGTSTTLTAQFHPLSGALFGVVLVGAVVASQGPPWRPNVRAHMLRFVVVPGLLSAASLAALARPWRQDSGRFAVSLHTHALDHGPSRWALVGALVGLLLCVAWGQRALAARVLTLVGLTVVAAQAMEAVAVSNYRYFLPVPLVLALWPMLRGDIRFGTARESALWMVSLVALWGPDVVRTQQMGTHAGITLALTDRRLEEEHARQPVHQVLDFLSARAEVKQPVLWDLVPQYVNWYRPGTPVALLPDAAAKTAANAGNALWDRPLRMPTWHVWFPAAGAGTWNCSGHCDYAVKYADPAHPDRPYTLTSGRLGLSVRMCPVMGVPANRVANAPFLLLSTGDFGPGSAPNEVMVVARVCDTPE